MQRWARRIAGLACVLVAACGHGTVTDPPPVTTVDDDIPADQLATTLYANVIKSERTYVGFSTEGGGFGQAGRSMKFVVDARNGGTTTYFTNANYAVNGVVPDYAKYHYEFAQEVLGISEDAATFNDNAYYTDAKRYIGGSVQTYVLGPEAQLTYALQFYPDDVIHEEGILAAAQIVKPLLKIPGAHFAFVATGPQQTFERVADALRAIQVEPMTIEQVLGNVRYLPLNPGEAWGYLRIFPQDQSLLRPTDIPVFDELPLDLSVVAGTITRSFQDVTSHVNLKSKERGTPNMMLRDAAPDSPELAPFADQPVHLVVGKASYLIEATTPEVVAEKLRERTDKPWIPLQIASEPALRSYDDMCPVLSSDCVQDGGRYGGKANGLGFLANGSVLGRLTTPPSLSATFGYDLAPFGYGVPVSRYVDFVAANPVLASKLADFIAAEKGGNLSSAERAAKVADVQAAFYVATLPAAHLAEVESAMGALKTRFPAVSELKFRSSANAEDIPTFDGAGLHDSFSVKYAARDNADFSCAIERDDSDVVTKLKVSPRTAQCALKAVYASLWNQRAVEERSFARLDHETAAMGIAIVPAYDTDEDVIANGVVITRAVGGADVLGYTLTLQQGNNLVTNPDPGTIAQRTLVTFSADPQRPDRYTMVRPAVPVAGGPAAAESVLTDAQIADVVRVAVAVEQPYCSVKPSYALPAPDYQGTPRTGDGNCAVIQFSESKSSSLDMEFKLLRSGRVVLKQVREFHGR